MNELCFGSVPQTPFLPRPGRLSSPPVSRPLAVKLGGQTDIRRRACPPSPRRQWKRPAGGKEVDGGGWVYADQARPRGECAPHVCRRNSTSRRRLTKAECSGSIIVIMSFLFHEVRAPGPLTIRRVIDRTCMILSGTRRNIYIDGISAFALSQSRESSDPNPYFSNGALFRVDIWFIYS